MGWRFLKFTGKDRKRVKVPKVLCSGSCTTNDVRSLRGIQVSVFIFFLLFLPPLPSGAVKHFLPFAEGPYIPILLLRDDPRGFPFTIIFAYGVQVWFFP